MKKIIYARAGLILALATSYAGTAVAQDSGNREVSWTKKREFVYFLPRTSVAANVGQRILSCPEKFQDEPAVETVVTLLSEQGPDPKGMVRIDSRSGFMAKRTTKLTLSPDGTLTAFNAATEGQGGDVVAAAIKAAVTVGSLAFGAPPAAVPIAGMSVLESVLYRGGSLPPGANSLPPARKPAVECKATVKAALSKLALLETQIAELEDSVADGEAGAAEVDLLKLRREQQKKLQSKLTLTSPKPAVFAVDSRPSTASRLMKLLPPIDLSGWFEPASSADALEWLARIPGRSGFMATLTPDKALFAALGGDGSVLSQNAQPYLFYRRPVPAKVSVQPCLTGTVQNGTCKPDETNDGKEISETKKVSIPQLSGLYSIAIGSGGIFGTRQASAKFDATGAPTELEYGSGSAGADLTKVLGAANDSIVTLRDAELAAIKRAAEEATALKTLDEARKALQKEE